MIELPGQQVQMNAALLLELASWKDQRKYEVFARFLEETG